MHFEQFAKQWITEKKPEWRTSQIQNVEDIFRIYLNPFFGKIAVNCIKKSLIMQFRGQLVENGNAGKSLSASRINHIMTPLRMVINEAAERFEFESPWKNIKPLTVPKSDIQPFNLDEVMLILQNLRADFKPYYTVRFFTGLRTGEIDGLTWNNVDFERRQLIINQAIVNGEMGETKTQGSNRIVQMNQLVYDALLAQKAISFGKSEFVFCSKNGSSLNHRNVTKRVWYPLLRYLELEKRNPYQTRHTTATLWLASGESPEWIATQLGHSSSKMLFSVYSRFVPNLTRKDGSALQRQLVAFLASRGQSDKGNDYRAINLLLCLEMARLTNFTSRIYDTLDNTRFLNEKTRQFLLPFLPNLTDFASFANLHHAFNDLKDSDLYRFWQVTDANAMQTYISKVRKRKPRGNATLLIDPATASDSELVNFKITDELHQFFLPLDNYLKQQTGITRETTSRPLPMKNVL